MALSFVVQVYVLAQSSATLQNVFNAMHLRCKCLLDRVSQPLSTASKFKFLLILHRVTLLFTHSCMCSSSRNVAQLIRLILKSSKPLRPVYYYTRCLSQYPQPVAYGEHLVAYRQAYGIALLPTLVTSWFVEFFVVHPLHWFTLFFKNWIGFSLPFLESVDYLLQVTLDEHTFNMTETLQDFPEIVTVEETIVDCFARRRRFLKKKRRESRN